jgi:hypothetical protein
VLLFQLILGQRVWCPQDSYARVGIRPPQAVEYL